MSFVRRYYNKEYVDCYIFRFASTPQPLWIKRPVRADFYWFYKIVASSNVLAIYKRFESMDRRYIFGILLSNSPKVYIFALWNTHETLINNNQPLGKNSIKNIRFCAAAFVHLRIGHAPLRALTDPCATKN